MSRHYSNFRICSCVSGSRFAPFASRTWRDCGRSPADAPPFHTPGTGDPHTRSAGQDMLLSDQVPVAPDQEPTALATERVLFVRNVAHVDIVQPFPEADFPCSYERRGWRRRYMSHLVSRKEAADVPRRVNSQFGRYKAGRVA